MPLPHSFIQTSARQDHPAIPIRCALHPPGRPLPSVHQTSGALRTHSETPLTRRPLPLASETRPLPLSQPASSLGREGSGRFGRRERSPPPPSSGSASSLPPRPPRPQEHLGARVPGSRYGRHGHVRGGAEAQGAPGARGGGAGARRGGGAALQPGAAARPAAAGARRGGAGGAARARSG